MNWPSHLAYPYFLAQVIAFILGEKLHFSHILVLFFFSLLPDVDLVIHWVYRTATKRHLNMGINHHKWPSHWPISYIPFAVLFILVPNTYTALMIFGVLSHLVLDSFACVWGVMWFAPFSKRWFNYQVVRFSRAKNGLQWFSMWKKSSFHVVEWISFALVLAHIFFFSL